MPFRKIHKLQYVIRHKGVGALFAKCRDKLQTEIQRILLPLNLWGPRFLCPCCGHLGPFLTSKGQRYCLCPRCGARARHRLQRLVLEELFGQFKAGSMRILHFAPETILQHWLQQWSRMYITADLARNYYIDSYSGRLTVVCDLQQLPFGDFSFDVVFCSHVLEHVKDDRQAIKEIYRVLAWNGTAILPVPVVAGDSTIDYGELVRQDGGHVRAPGLDYFNRYTEAGFDVEVRRSDQFPGRYQVYCFEDRDKWSTADRRMIPWQRGERHMDYVPVCSKKPLRTAYEIAMDTGRYKAS